MEKDNEIYMLIRNRDNKSDCDVNFTVCQEKDWLHDYKKTKKINIDLGV